VWAPPIRSNNNTVNCWRRGGDERSGGRGDDVRALADGRVQQEPNLPVACMPGREGDTLTCRRTTPKISAYCTHQQLNGFLQQEKVYITPSPMGVGLHSPLAYETVYITP
jgi:hypothetical protein